MTRLGAWILGGVIGGMIGGGPVIAFDHLGHSSHTVGPIGSILLGAGCAALGGLVGIAALGDSDA